jgi:hypothetical protein
MFFSIFVTTYVFRYRTVFRHVCRYVHISLLPVRETETDSTSLKTGVVAALMCSQPSTLHLDPKRITYLHTIHLFQR